MGRKRGQEIKESVRGGGRGRDALGDDEMISCLGFVLLRLLLVVVFLCLASTCVWRRRSFMFSCSIYRSRLREKEIVRGTLSPPGVPPSRSRKAPQAKTYVHSFILSRPAAVYPVRDTPVPTSL